MPFVFALLVGCSGGEESSAIIEQPPPVNHPAQGTVLSESCDGTTLIKEIADGNGGSTTEQTSNSEQCGYVAPPSEGTILDEYCEDPHTLVIVTADGAGGEIVEKTENSSPPEQPTSRANTKGMYLIILLVQIVP